MISPSTRELCSSIFLNVQIHFSVLLLSFNLIVLLPDDEFCTIRTCVSFIYLFSLLWSILLNDAIYSWKVWELVLRSIIYNGDRALSAAWLEKLLSISRDTDKSGCFWLLADEGSEIYNALCRVQNSPGQD